MKVTVTVTKGLTINVGNYESVRVDIGVELNAEGETPGSQRAEMEEAYKRATKFVNQRLNMEVEYWSERRKGSGPLLFDE